MSLQVIGAGFGRTGTMSMKAALEKLGYIKCHHMDEVIGRARQVDHWEAIGKGKIPDWDDLFEGFQASVDFPSCLYYRELAEHFPEAKVLLTVRSADDWYKSARVTIYELSKSVPRWLEWFPAAGKMVNFVNTVIWNGKFDGHFEDEAHAKRVFNEHNEEVKRLIPAERLLVMNVAEGWEPLCRFLGKEIPEEDFPRVNDTAEFRKNIIRLKILKFLPWIFAAGGTLTLALMLTS